MKAHNAHACLVTIHENTCPCLSCHDPSSSRWLLFLSSSNNLILPLHPSACERVHYLLCSCWSFYFVSHVHVLKAIGIIMTFLVQNSEGCLPRIIWTLGACSDDMRKTFLTFLVQNGEGCSVSLHVPIECTSLG